MTVGPGIHAMSAVEYHADPCERPSLSASIANVLCTQSPLHAWYAHPRLNHDYERVIETKFALGTVCHALLLQGEEIAEVLPHDEYRTNEAKDARDAALSAGRIPLKRSEWERAKAMVDAAWKQLDGKRYLPIPFCDGKPEQTIVWEENGVLCRALIDWLHDDGFAVSDYKTTSASADPRKWVRTAYGIGADVQVAFHSRGVKAIYGRDPVWQYVVQETYPPYALSVCTLDNEAIALANEKVDYALKRWDGCLTAGVWPGYEPGVHMLETPGWEMTRWLEQSYEEAA